MGTYSQWLWEISFPELLPPFSLTCNRSVVERQAGPGQVVLIGVRGNDISDRLVSPVNGAKPYLRRRAAAEIESRTYRPKERLDQFAVLMAALKTRGIDLTPADLKAGAAAVRARRADDARA